MSDSRILFAAQKSGSGKTMITCGVLALLQKKGWKTAAFKCGPDYIDPMFHREVLGVPSGNLDTFFTEEETVRYLLGQGSADKDITVIEGVMGYYDGLGGSSVKGSTYETARVTDTPVILVVDARGASVSLAAVIRGMMAYRQDSHIKGVILNRVSAGYYGRLKALIEEECGIPVLGYVPELKKLTIPSRHLGLMQPEELADCKKWVEELAQALEPTIDLEGIFAVASQASPCGGEAPVIPKLSAKVRIAVARDAAFSFYYQENLSLLEKMGAELVYFSPLAGEELPPEADGLLLGGGYPEHYVKELERSVTGARIREACLAGLPCLAECGGFLYLQKELADKEGVSGKMADVLSGKGFPTGKLCRFGYVELTSLTSGVLGDAGQTIKGHEFHHWDCTENGADFLARKPGRDHKSETGAESEYGTESGIDTVCGKNQYTCMIHTDSLAAGFPHLYYYSNPGMVFSFLLNARDYQAKRLSKAHWDSIAKPIDSLGQLERIVTKLCWIAGTPRPEKLAKRALLVLCGDHGVVKEGVTQTGSEVTKIVSENFARGCSTVNYMAEAAKVDVYTIDMGMDTSPYPEKNLVTGAVIDKKVAKGCGNIALEPAMTLEQCRQAMDTGRLLVGQLKEMGYGIVATGEMGIGNTTPTSVLAALFLHLSAEEVTGKGAGLSKEGLERKRLVVNRAIERVKKMGITDPMELLAQAGGYEIAGMAGVFLGGVQFRMPIVIDGAISSVAALAAARIDKRVKKYAIASHESEELTGKLALKELGLSAPIHAGMCLGEGTGAMALLPLIDMALSVYENMGSFTEYQITPYVRYEESDGVAVAVSEFSDAADGNPDKLCGRLSAERCTGDYEKNLTE